MDNVNLDEYKMIINSKFYCPECKGGGDLFVKNTNDYFNNKKNTDYYCKRCKLTFKIEVVRSDQKTGSSGLDFPRINLYNVFGTAFLLFLMLNFVTIGLVFFLYSNNEFTCAENISNVRSIFIFPIVYGDLCYSEQTATVMMIFFGLLSILMFINKKERGWY